MCEENKIEYETFHEEEMPTRIKSDQMQISKLTAKIRTMHTSPLRTKNHLTQELLMLHLDI